MESSLSVIAGALFGLGAILIYFGVRRLADKTLDAEARRRGFWPLNAGLASLALSLFLIME